MMVKGRENIYQVEMISIEDLVPQGHLLRQISNAVDFSKIYEFVEVLQNEDIKLYDYLPSMNFTVILDGFDTKEEAEQALKGGNEKNE